MEVTLGKWEVTLGKWEATLGKWEATLGKWEATLGKWEATLGKWEATLGNMEVTHILLMDTTTHLMVRSITNRMEHETTNKNIIYRIIFIHKRGLRTCSPFCVCTSKKYDICCINHHSHWKGEKELTYHFPYYPSHQQTTGPYISAYNLYGQPILSQTSKPLGYQPVLTASPGGGPAGLLPAPNNLDVKFTLVINIIFP
jgi:hypothetical protein